MRRPGLLVTTAVLALLTTMAPGSSLASAPTDRASCPPDIPRAGFADVYPLSPHAFDIDCLAWRSVIDEAPAFHPEALLTRWEMAVWLDRALRWVQDRYGSVPSPFSDTSGIAAAESIAAISQVDVTRGIGDGRFDPYGAVPRWQMALFLTRAFEAAGNPLPATNDQAFGDIGGETAEAQLAINQLAMLGVTRGTGPGSFTPDEPVTREQMASFVARLLEEIWVIQPVSTACDTTLLPIRCTGAMVSVSPPADVRIRVPMFMADHVGDLDVAEERFADPGTRVELFVDGAPVPVTSNESRHSGTVYRYWEGVIAAGATGRVTVEARTYLAGTLTTVREVRIEFR